MVPKLEHNYVNRYNQTQTSTSETKTKNYRELWEAKYSESNAIVIRENCYGE